MTTYTCEVVTSWNTDKPGLNEQAVALDYPGYGPYTTVWSDVTNQPDENLIPDPNVFVSRGEGLSESQMTALEADARYVVLWSEEEIPEVRTPEEEFWEDRTFMYSIPSLTDVDLIQLDDLYADNAYLNDIRERYGELPPDGSPPSGYIIPTIKPVRTGAAEIKPPDGKNNASDHGKLVSDLAKLGVSGLLVSDLASSKSRKANADLLRAKLRTLPKAKEKK